VTRKTQIGLLTAACVLCCAGVFLGARLSNRSHAAADSTPMTIEPPELPTPIATDSGSSKPAIENKDMPTIVAVVETPPPRDLPVPEPVESTKGNKAAPPIPDTGIEDPLPTLPSGRSAPENTDPEIPKPLSKPVSGADVVTVAADQPAKNDKVDLPPPPPPPNAGARDPMLDPVASDLSPPKRGSSSPPALIGRELTGKTPPEAPAVSTIPPSTPAPIPDTPLPSGSRPAHAAPTSPVKPSTPEPPISTAPTPADPPPSVDPLVAPPDRNTPPPARIVPVSPTTPESVKVTPVIKKPVSKAKTLPMTGTHACKMDRDHGVTLPKEVRDQLGEQEVLFVTLGTDHSVWVTTAAGLEKLADRLEKTTDVDDETKVMRRRYFAQTERVAVDKSGHIVLPATLADSAGLKQDAVLIGVGDHLELWDAQRWQKVSQPMPGGETPDASAADSHEEL
jgi:MraZ protein